MEFYFENLGPISKANLTVKPFTIIVGKNQSGKSFITKFAYSILSGISEYNKKDEPINGTALQNKVRWVFQQANIGELVNKFSEKRNCLVKWNNKIEIKINPTDKWKFAVKIIEKNLEFRNHISYLPTPLLFDIEKAILNYRGFYKANYGVPDIYWDTLRDISSIGISETPSVEIIKKIEEIVNGKFRYDSAKGAYFLKNKKEFHFSSVATGVKIFGIIYLLLERGLLDKDSILFIEEPENHLHPSLAVKLVDVLTALTELGVKVVITTHSPLILRYTEFLINSDRFSLENCSFLNLELENETSIGESNSNMETLLKMMEPLNESYFDITLKEYGNF